MIYRRSELIKKLAIAIVETKKLINIALFEYPIYLDRLFIDFGSSQSEDLLAKLLQDRRTSIAIDN